MKLQKAFWAFGMLGSLAFLCADFLGTILWRGYNPVTSYISELFADGAPHAFLTRTLLYLSETGLIIFLLTACVKLIKFYGISFKIGYVGLLIMAVVSILGYGLFPMTMDYIFNLKNLLHLIITIAILIVTVASLFLLAFGYLNKKPKRKIGRFTMVIAVLFLFFNVTHLYAIFSGMHILGLLQRLNIYTFQLYIFVMSWVYVFKSGTDEDTLIEHRAAEAKGLEH